MRFRGLLSIILVLAFVPLADARERHPTVQSLPEIARLQPPGDTVLILRGQLPRRLALRAERLARAVQTDVRRRFLSDRDKSALPPVDVCLFAGTAAYRRFVREVFGERYEFSDLGFYVPARRLVVANLGRSMGNLRHEMVHALIEDDFPDIPAWLDEGMGSLYGSARRAKRGFRFLVNYRLRHLRAARAAGALPDFPTLAASTRREVYGGRAPVYYALARHLLLYLESRGELEHFFAAMRAHRDPDGHLATIERFVDRDALLAWTDGLRIEVGRRSARQVRGR